MATSNGIGLVPEDTRGFQGNGIFRFIRKIRGKTPSPLLPLIFRRFTWNRLLDGRKNTLRNAHCRTFSLKIVPLFRPLNDPFNATLTSLLDVERYWFITEEFLLFKVGISRWEESTSVTFTSIDWNCTDSPYANTFFQAFFLTFKRTICHRRSKQSLLILKVFFASVHSRNSYLTYYLETRSLPKRKRVRAEKDDWKN